MIMPHKRWLQEKKKMLKIWPSRRGILLEDIIGDDDEEADEKEEEDDDEEESKQK